MVAIIQIEGARRQSKSRAFLKRSIDDRRWEEFSSDIAFP
jgi:hypothetical protein